MFARNAGHSSRFQDTHKWRMRACAMGLNGAASLYSGGQADDVAGKSCHMCCWWSSEDSSIAVKADQGVAGVHGLWALVGCRAAVKA
jgi:hypothetical protein